MSGKRKADKQLTRDVGENEDEEGGQDGNWQRASSETMKGRRVVRARRRCGEPLHEEHPTSPSRSTEDVDKQELGVTTTPNFVFGQMSGMTPSWPTFAFGPPKTEGTGETVVSTSPPSTISSSSTSSVWPTFFGTPKTDGTVVSTAPSTTSSSSTSSVWPTFSFGPPKTDGVGETVGSTASSTTSVLSTFNFKTTDVTGVTAGVSTTPSLSTAPVFPSFSFGSLGTPTPSVLSGDLPKMSFPWSTPKDGEKKEETGSTTTDTNTSFPNFLKESDKKLDYLSFTTFSYNTNFSFSSSTSSASFKIGDSTSESSPFKLESPLGTLSGVGSDANKTRELTSTFPSSFGSSIWGRDIQPPKDPVTGIGASSPESKNIKLAKLDSHTTGEEGETTEIEVRGRLYEFVKEEGKSTWKERGVGPFKINHDIVNNRYRIVMRTDNALRVVLNGLLYNEMTYEKISDRQLRFTCVSTLERNTTKVGSYLLKLANPSDTDSLKQVLLRCRPNSRPLASLQGTPKKGDVGSSEVTNETEAVSTSDATESKGGSEDASTTTESTVTDSTVTSELKPQLEV